MKNNVKPHTCGAKTRKGTPCKGISMKNGRCRMHGGCSSGPKTKEGKARIGAAQYKHGRRTKSATAERNAFNRYLKYFNEKLDELI